MNKLEARIAEFDVEKLKEVAAMLANDFQEGADLVFEAVTRHLMDVMPEDEFVQFCDGL